MDRRAFLTSAARAGVLAVAGAIPTPAISQRADARTVRLAPHADLANFDPIWTPAYIARNAGLLVWDMLYGVDARLEPQRQMVEAEEVSSDGLTWTFRLRPGLKFHDGEPVLAKDAVASISRWAARDPLGQMLKAIENELIAVDDRTFRWVLKKPYPKMLLALGKVTTPCCFIMPARIAATDPFKQINEYVGSGPMRFARNEWVPGARAAFVRFADYLPRPEEPSWLAGGKRVVADRIEWIVMPDAATGAAALQTGEIDWLEFVVPDLVPMLRKNRNLIVEINDPLGLVGILGINHLFPPFNDVRARRAILTAINQEEYMHSFVGSSDAKLWKPMPSYFTPGTPLYNEEGGEILKGPRRFDVAKRLLAESGYAGEPIVCMAAQDLPHHKAWGDVTVDLLKRLDINVDFAAVDWGTVVARRPQKKQPRDGGWHLYLTSPYGVDLAAPISIFLRADGNAGIGWPNNPAVETELAAWFDATSPEEEKAVARRLNKVALDHVLFAPLGVCMRHYAWRKSLTGITQGPLPLFWGVSKTV
jgi:peptide/nickel transport system substrate-binding protein